MSIPATADPIALFADWFEEAHASEAIPDHTAMTLATADADGHPDARMVLLKGFGQDGFVFYTNLGSPKARQLEANPHAALCFHWAPLDKQVRIQGPVQPVPDTEADAYFASRERLSQIGAWASKQSQALEGRFLLERRVAHHTARFGLGAVPRPPFWSGFRLVPHRIEFWHKQPYRLHDRLEYTRAAEGWVSQRLFP